ncbi:MAG TPA: hypothetical protein VGY56_21555, partial [Verrucomicrobiae bacterium]|nr:hypothetical protein [Verrucomicrobiae bacterium]
MTKLVIFDWGKQKRDVDFVGYGTTGNCCYIYNGNNDRCAIDLWLPSGFGFKFQKNPLSAALPVEISRAILQVPSFDVVSQDLAQDFFWLKAQDKSAPAKDPFPLIAVHPRKQWNGSDLAKKLWKLLNGMLRRRLREYESAKQEIAKRPRDEQEAALRELEHRFSFIGNDFRTASIFQTTLNDVKAGLFGFLNSVLQDEFLEYHHLDLNRIEKENAEFCRRICLEGTDLSQSTLNILAKRVRYRVHFRDNTDCWLEGIYERPLTTPQEIDEFERLEASQKSTAPPRGKVEVLDGNTGPLRDKIDEMKSAAEKEKAASTEKDQRLAIAQRELSAGLLITDPDAKLQQEMGDVERYFYNQLVQPN